MPWHKSGRLEHLVYNCDSPIGEWQSDSVCVHRYTLRRAIVQHCTRTVSALDMIQGRIEKSFLQLTRRWFAVPGCDGYHFHIHELTLLTCILVLVSSTMSGSMKIHLSDTGKWIKFQNQVLDFCCSQTCRQRQQLSVTVWFRTKQPKVKSDRVEVVVVGLVLLIWHECLNFTSYECHEWERARPRSTWGERVLADGFGGC